MRGGNPFERSAREVRGSATKFSRSSPVFKKPLMYHPMTLSSRVKMDGKPSDKHRRHAAYQHVQRRARRACAAKLNTLHIISQNVNGLPTPTTPTEGKREECFLKAHSHKADICRSATTTNPHHRNASSTTAITSNSSSKAAIKELAASASF